MDIIPAPDSTTTAARARISELVSNFNFSQEGLREIAALLPPADDELQRWLEQAIAAQAEAEFDFMIFAAAMTGRKLSASLLPVGLFLLPNPQFLAWLAWHMEGAVGPALLEAVDAGGLPVSHSTMALFVAAAWWREHRPEEALPKKIGAAVEALVRDEPKDPVVLSYRAALIDLLQDEEANPTAKPPKIPGLTQGKLRATRKLGKLVRTDLMRKLKRPFAKMLPERARHRYLSKIPFLRPIPKVGRNVVCHCGSAKKYKDCCEHRDQESIQRTSRARTTSPEEIARQLNTGLTQRRLEELRASEILFLDPLLVPADLQADYLLRLAAFRRFETLVSAFEKLGVPEALEDAWKATLFLTARAGRPDIVARLAAMSPQEELPAFCHLMKTQHDPAAFAPLLEQIARQALAHGSVDAIADIALGLLFSPAYRALGILVARGTLPLGRREECQHTYEDILEARGELDLPPDDEFADFMEQLEEREQISHRDLLGKQAEQEAKATENRRLKEERATLQRSLQLSVKREREAAAQAGLQAPAGPSEETRRLQTQLKNVESLIRDLGEERIALRHEVATLKAELAQLRLAQGLTAEGAAPAPDEEPGEELDLSGQQPVRLLRFAEKFHRSLDRLPRQASAAVMTHLGRLAAGDENEMTGRKKIYAVDGVLRSRVGDFRVLFRFTPRDVEVIDVVDRKDLEKRLKTLRASGVPAFAT